MAKAKVSAAAVIEVHVNNANLQVKNRKPTPHPKDKAGTMKQFTKASGTKRQRAPKIEKAPNAIKKAKTQAPNGSKIYEWSYDFCAIELSESSFNSDSVSFALQSIDDYESEDVLS